jgi:hypothetical protein
MSSHIIPVSTALVRTYSGIGEGGRSASSWRATGFWSRATASSMSMITASVPDLIAFSMRSRRCPGVNSIERSASMGCVPPVAVT